ncbi:MAG: chorismate synthase [Alloprevotella sp.]|nr:chorismate synthase [Alloprevotella sp.]
MGNTFGHILQLTTFGESHGYAIGGVIDGYPAGITIDMDFVRKELSRRATNQSTFSSARKEVENVTFLSGIFKGKSLGTPIAFVVQNEDARPSDYETLRDVYRPSHADYTYMAKYGLRDHRGGGRASARETIARVVAGALAKTVLLSQGIHIQAFTSQIGPIALSKPYTDYDLSTAESNDVRCPDRELATKMQDFLTQTRLASDSAGGVVTCVIKGCPAGIGEPVFGKLESVLASAMLSIPAAKGFELGGGFSLTNKYGSEANDAFFEKNGQICTRSNNSGGIQGGISNGEDIYFNVAFKPIPTIATPQETVNMQGDNVIIETKGRHDVCAVPRAVVIVEAMAALSILDALLLQRTNRI